MQNRFIGRLDCNGYLLREKDYVACYFEGELLYKGIITYDNNSCSYRIEAEDKNSYTFYPIDSKGYFYKNWVINFVSYFL